MYYKVTQGIYDQYNTGRQKKEESIVFVFHHSNNDGLRNPSALRKTPIGVP